MNKERERERETAMEFAVEDILFEEIEAASAAVQPAVTSDDARSSSGLILPSMTIDPADTKTPYSDATQVGKRKERKLGNTAGAPQLAPVPVSDRVDATPALSRFRARAGSRG